jgi:A/G-specific adenine glycosylase
LNVERLLEILIPPKSIRAFRRSLHHWYLRHGRDLPWRRTSDPYAIFVSEVMLQQTQVSTVIPYYERWLCRFPDIERLALASESEVLHVWQGLGYYSRARNLHAAAKILRDKYRGVFPRCPKELAELPGAGRYTANAIATFAFDRSVPIIEANTARVIARVFDVRVPIDERAGRNALWQAAEALLPKRGARIHNSALMDLGATICTARTPKCGICPVRNHCRAKNPLLLPIKKTRPREERLTEFHSFDYARGRVLLEQSQKRWRGLWILPSLKGRPANGYALYVSEFPFTHHRITLSVFATSRGMRPNETQRWFPIRNLEAIAIPSPHRRALRQLLSTS